MSDDTVPLEFMIKELSQENFAKAFTRRYCDGLGFTCKYAAATGLVSQAEFVLETPYFTERLRVKHDGNGWALTIRGDKNIRPATVVIESGARLDHFIDGVSQAKTLIARLAGEIEKSKRIGIIVEYVGDIIVDRGATPKDNGERMNPAERDIHRHYVELYIDGVFIMTHPIAGLENAMIIAVDMFMGAMKYGDLDKFPAGIRAMQLKETYLSARLANKVANYIVSTNEGESLYSDLLGEALKELMGRDHEKPS